MRMTQGENVGSNYDECVFRHNIDTALVNVRRILENTRNPQLPSEIPHRYADKFLLAESICNVALAAQLNCLERFGVDVATLRKMKTWSGRRNVTLQFQRKEECSFNRTESREMERAPSHHVVETVSTMSASLVSTVTKEVRVVSAVTEHYWDVRRHWELAVFAGNSDGSQDQERISLMQRVGRCEIKTTGDRTLSPRPEKLAPGPLDVDITWLLQNMSDEHQLQFKIDRANASCRTPRRNDEIYKAFVFFRDFSIWCSNVSRYLRILNPLCPDLQDALPHTGNPSIFVPVLPLFDDKSAIVLNPQPPSIANQLVETSSDAQEGMVEEALVDAINLGQGEDEKGSLLLPKGDFNLFLAEQRRGIAEKIAWVNASFPSAEAVTLISGSEVQVVEVAHHAIAISQHLHDGLDYIEALLTQQLTAAIGKQVSVADFENYMIYHNHKLFKPEFEPVPFCYDVRRPEHAPDGTLSIETSSLTASPAFKCGNRSPKASLPVHTIAAQFETRTPFFFAISASTRVHCNGVRRVHALVAQQFGEAAPAPLSLVARARQFSSFLLVVGKMNSADSLEPAAAIILQNKDELIIPLLLAQLPTPKAFRDAIESLSPEQQRFARAFRNMQLASSVFGICVIQLKPQLEKVLKLPPDSLTKEIRLTQDLLSLFIEYQVPTDLLSFDGTGLDDWEVIGEGAGGVGNTGSAQGERGCLRTRAHAHTTLAVETVKRHVAALKGMIEENKALELAEQQKRAQLQKARALESVAKSTAHFGGFGGGGLVLGAGVGGGAPGGGGGFFGAPAGGGGVFGGAPAGASGGGVGVFGGAPPSSGWGAALPDAPRALGFGMCAPPPQGAPCAFFAASDGPGDGGGGGGGGGHCNIQMMCDSTCVVSEQGVAATAASAEVKASRSGEERGEGDERGEAGRASTPKHPLVSDDEGHVQDITTLPRKLDARLDALDTDAAVRPTTIEAGDVWTRISQAQLLGSASTAFLDAAAQDAERAKAFDLLDALSLSGALAIESAELHMIVAATHRFDKSLMHTVIRDNVSPIEKLEHSTLVIAATIHNKPVEQLVHPHHASRLAASSPALFASD